MTFIFQLAVLALTTVSCSMIYHRDAHQASLPAQSTHQLLGFRFEVIDEGLLITEVTLGQGAAVVGLQKGDLVLTINDLPALNNISILHDVSVSEVSLGIRKSLSFEVDTVVVHRGITVLVISEDSVHPWLVWAAMGDIESIVASIQTDDWPEISILEKVVRLVNRNYNQDLSLVINALIEAPWVNPQIGIWLSQQCLQYNQLEQIFVIQNKVEELGLVDWRLNDSQYSFSGATYESALIQAYWETKNHSAAIEIIRQLQPWHLETGFESMVGLAPYGPIHRVEIPALPQYSEMGLELIDGSNWVRPKDQWTIICFWATWCAPCEAELPELVDWSNLHSDVSLLTINVEDNIPLDKLNRVLKRWGIDSLLIAQDDVLAQQFASAIPTLVLLDKNGSVRFKHSGYNPEIFEKLEGLISSDTEAMEQLVQFRGELDWVFYPMKSLSHINWDGQHWWGWNGQLLQLADEWYKKEHLPLNVEETDHVIVGSHHRCFTKYQGRQLFCEVDGKNWRHTLPSKLIDSNEFKGDLWLALEDSVVVLRDGEVVARDPISVRNLQTIQQSSLTQDGPMMVASYDETSIHLDLLGSEIVKDALPVEPWVAKVLPDGTMLRDSVEDVFYSSDKTWVHRQNLNGYSLVGIKTEEPKVLLETPYKFEILRGDFDRDDVWIFFPRRGLLQIQSP